VGNTVGVRVPPSAPIHIISIDDVGAATAFLALDGAKLIAGSVMSIDGGYHIID
jgi:enoyl-[acyl-carrier-protein] reductase (NADH)